MKWLTSCVLLWHLPRLSFGTHAKSTFYYFACKFDVDQVKPLIIFGEQFYTYLQNNGDLWEEYSKNMVKNDPNRGKKDYLNREYSHGHNELHTTMFFGKTEEDRKKYEERDVVKEALNKPVQLKINGVFITPHTMGFRVELPETALVLWDANDKTPEEKKPLCSEISKFCDEKLPKSEGGIFSPGNFSKGSRAHATVLTSALSRPVQTGLDLVDIEYSEKGCIDNRCYRAVTMEDGWSAKMRYYGFGRFVFYLDKPHVVASIFRKVEIVRHERSRRKEGDAEDEDEMKVEDRTEAANPDNLLPRRGPYCVGEKVRVLLHTPKGRSSWSKAKTIVKVFGDSTYELSDGQIWSTRRMKSCAELPVNIQHSTGEPSASATTRQLQRTNKGKPPKRLNPSKNS